MAEPFKKSTLREYFESIVIAVILALFIRTFVVQAFKIPTGSMENNLLIGDHLLVNKFIYGPSESRLERALLPLGTIKRRDVLVFKYPEEPDRDFIKRVIGLPGDEISVRSGVLYINGQAVPKVRKGDFISPEEDRPIARFEETLPNGVKYYVLDSTPNGQFDNVGPYKVPAGHYFMMGDNRDNSTDSREQSPRFGVGYVPFENLVGRAEIIFFSAAVDDPNAFRLTQPWHWPMDIRWNRIFSLVR